MKTNFRSVGTTYEQLGAEYLEKEGYSFVDKNLYTPFGEVDLVLTKDERLFFVEVKYRSNQNYGSARESITTLKLKRLKKSVAYLMKGKYNAYNSFSISFLGIETQADTLRFDFIDNIFS